MDSMVERGIVVFTCLALGGLLKGATGAGAPIIAIPALAMAFDVQFAVAVMAIPNLATNLLQGWHYRRHLPPRRFIVPFALAGGTGSVAGSLLLASLPHDVLALILAVAVFFYVGFRIVRADWVLPFKAAVRLAVPVGLVAGLLQGSSGISAPASLSFLNAMRLERPVFVAAVAATFVAMTFPQVPTLAATGVLDLPRFMVSLAAIVPVVGFMPVGARLARHIPARLFDRVILAMLVVLALKLVHDALA